MIRCLMRSAFLTHGRKHIDKQSTDVVKKKQNKQKKTPMFLIMRKKRTGFTIQNTWINDKW